MSTRPSAWASIALLLRFECEWQSRDFFAWLAAGIFFALTLGFAATGVVQLVGDLGDTPRNAPWALAHAMAGVTAFGQVITAITAATTVLRDVATRAQPLVLTTGLSWRTYLGGRFVGTLVVLLAIYAAIPAGLLLGDAIAVARGDAARVPFDAAAYLAPWMGLVLPNVVVIAAIFFCVGAIAGGLGPVLATGLALIACWQAGLSLAAAGTVGGALLDPFGNAALMIATADWEMAERATRAVPMTGLLVANRLLWLSFAASAVVLTLRWWRPVTPRSTTAREHRAHAPPLALGSTLAPLRGATALAVWCAEWRFGWHWVTREPGFGVLVFLALLNAVVHAWPVATDPTALVRALEFHARLFAILIATIYAGELIWRDVDVRAAPLLAALAARPRLRLDGRAVGVLSGLLLLPLALWSLALLLPLLRGAAPAPACTAHWLLGIAGAQFIVLFVSSVLVHRVLRHKTIAHLVLITAWVAAIALGVSAAARPWALWGQC